MKAVTVSTPGGITFPHAAQAIWITRTRTITSSGKTILEPTYLTISLSTADAHPAELQEWIRCEWLIEALHHIRDVTFREDSHQARTGNGPAVMATCVTPRSGSIAPAEKPTSPAPPDEPAAAPRPHHRRDQQQPENAPSGASWHRPGKVVPPALRSTRRPRAAASAAPPSRPLLQVDLRPTTGPRYVGSPWCCRNPKRPTKQKDQHR
jgi:hypothetical protein